MTKRASSNEESTGHGKSYARKDIPTDEVNVVNRKRGPFPSFNGRGWLHRMRDLVSRAHIGIRGNKASPSAVETGGLSLPSREDEESQKRPSFLFHYPRAHRKRKEA